MKSNHRRTLFLATHNQGKILEFREILGESWDIRTASDLKPKPAWTEDGQTFEENARIKARALYQAGVSRGCVLGEDSGICIDFLGGGPGILSGRFREEKGGADPCNQHILDLMSGVNQEKRGAFYISVLVFMDEHGRESIHQGLCRGTIGFQSSGTNGFDYDRIFIPDGHSKTMAQMSPDEKNALSHRKKALQSLASGLGIPS